jgi:uncharacterized membrane protein
MIYLVLFAHFVADFIFQKDEDAKNKSKSFKHLLSHILDYDLAFTVILSLGMLLLGKFSLLAIVNYTLLNSAIHLVVDYFTSKASAYYWSKQEAHNFFVVVGFDQFLHAVTLVATLPLLGV